MYKLSEWAVVGPWTEVRVEGNPLACDCHLVELRRHLEAAGGWRVGGARCGEGSAGGLAGRLLREVQLQELLCPLTPCPIPCSCSLNRWPAGLTLLVFLCVVNPEMFFSL